MEEKIVNFLKSCTWSKDEKFGWYFSVTQDIADKYVKDNGNDFLVDWDKLSDEAKEAYFSFTAPKEYLYDIYGKK